MANIFRAKFDAKDNWPIKLVTVYQDRAQITRVLDYKASEYGEVELKLENLPLTLMTETVRAEIESENATIYEVGSNRIDIKGKTKPMPEKVNEINQAIKKLNEEQQRLTKRLEWSGNYASNFVPTALNVQDKGKEMFEGLIGSDNLKKFSQVLDIYTNDSEEIDLRLIDIKEEIRLLEVEKNKITAEINQYNADQGRSFNEVNVLINVPENIAVENQIITIRLNYVVNRTSWGSKYDVRVAKAEKSVSIAYFGNVVNNSGEDWNEVTMWLSTAKPSRAGNLPKLPRAVVKLIPGGNLPGINIQATQHVQEQSKGKKKIKRNWRGRQQESAEINMLNAAVDDQDSVMELKSESEDEYDQDADGAIEELITDAVNESVTEAESRGGSAIFKLKRLITMESSTKSKRQTVGEVTLSPTFSYVVSPRVSPHCFLKCTAKNASNYVLVPGPMSVFFDDSFVTTTRMNLVRQNESFSVYLGVEESVKVDYQPEIAKDENIKGGIIKSKAKAQSVSRTVNVTNTRNETISCLIYEQVPLARDEKIKVEVSKPDLKKNSGKERYTLNKFNHLEARNEIKAGKTWSLQLDYRVEWPRDKDVIYNESLENMKVN